MNMFTIECLECGHKWYDTSAYGHCPSCQSPNIEMLYQAGQSLISVIIATAIVSFLVLALTNVTTLAFKSNATASANSDMVSYMDGLRNSLKDPVMATTALKNNSVKLPLVLVDPLNQSKKIALAGFKQQPNDAWSVNSIAVDSMVVVPSQTGLYRLTIGVTFKKDQKRVLGALYVHKTLTDVYCLVNGNIISSCSGLADISTIGQQFCTSMSGTWDVKTAKCTMPSSGPNDCNGNDNGNHNGQYK